MAVVSVLSRGCVCVVVLSVCMLLAVIMCAIQVTWCLFVFTAVICVNVFIS